MSNVETLSALQRRLNASIPQQQIRSEMDNRLKHIGRTAKVAGFRPGKVPRNIIERQYGAQVYQEVVGEALERSFAATAQSLELKVVGSPDFELKPAASADQIDYSATFEVYPEVTLGDISADTVERVNYAATDADLETTLTTLRRQRAEFVLVGRAAANEDKVTIDFRGTLDGVVFNGGESTDYPFTLGHGRMLPEFEAAILGMSAGETKSFDMTFPEGYHGKDVAGKQVNFTITVKQVEEARLPELDAALARELGVQDGSVETLMTEVRDNLEREVNRRVKVLNKEQAMNALQRLGQVELPKTMVAWEMENLRSQTIQDMESRGAKMPQGMNLPVELFQERAEHRVRLGLILSEVVSQHSLDAKPEQMMALLQDYARSYEHPEEVIRWYQSDESRMQEVANLVVEQNVVDWVMANAKVSDKEITFDQLMSNS